MGRMTVRPLLIKYLTEHPDDIIHVSAMETDLGLTRAQVQQGMTYLMDKGVAEAVVRGSAWRYVPPSNEVRLPDSAFHFEGDPVPGETVEVIQGPASGRIAENGSPGDLMEVVKCLNGGKILLQDNDGVLFVATRLDV